MPRAPKACAKFGCETRVPGGQAHCGKHKSAWPKQAGTPRTATTAWKKLRANVLRLDGYQCQRCGATGVPLEVDHVHNVTAGGDEYSVDNTQTLCVPCHRAKTKTEARAGLARRMGGGHPVPWGRPL